MSTRSSSACSEKRDDFGGRGIRFSCPARARQFRAGSLDVALVDAATAASPRRVVLLAHSLAVATAVKWAAGASDSQLNKVAGALLVAATNVEDPDPSFDLVRPFAPMPLKCLPFPTLVVASRTDPRVSFDKATAFAAAWGADLADAGELGHMGNETRLGLWPAGLLMLGRLLGKARL
jgi:uncharacterized protein